MSAVRERVGVGVAESFELAFFMHHHVWSTLNIKAVVVRCIAAARCKPD